MHDLEEVCCHRVKGVWTLVATVFMERHDNVSAWGCKKRIQRLYPQLLPNRHRPRPHQSMEIKPLSAPIALGHPEFDSIVHVARLIQKIQKSSRNGIHPSEISRPWADIVDEDFEPLEVGGDFIYQIPPIGFGTDGTTELTNGLVSW